jgi:DNA-binding NarL/FixJ family response regulator
MLSLELDLQVVGEASDGAQAVVLAADLYPDVVLMDLRMPNLDGVGAIKAMLGRKSPQHQPHILVLTTYDTDADILRAIEAGAKGYLLKDTPIAELTAGIRAAARGEMVLAPHVAVRLAGSLSTQRIRLTKRELEVLELVSDGYTNAAIAVRLHIGEATVKTHLLRAFAKLGVDNRTEAVTEARHRGWIGL